MKELNKADREKLILELKPFWQKYKSLEHSFYEKVAELEVELNHKVKTPVKLGFFYVEGECEGIGAENEHDRAQFPLVHLDRFED